MHVSLGDEVLRTCSLLVASTPPHRGGSTPLPWSVLRLLQDLFVCRLVWFRDLDVTRRGWASVQCLDGETRVVQHDCAADDPETDRWVDRWWTGWSPPSTVLVLPMPCQPDRIRWVEVTRDERPFDDDETLAAEVVRPHLQEVWRRGADPANRVPQLSPREWEVLHLVGEGMGNGEIARRLFVAPATVRKHLEHVYDKVGTRTRLAAARMMLPHSPYRDPRGCVRGGSSGPATV